MTIGIDASRANNTQKTGVEWYAFFVIQELKSLNFQFSIFKEDINVILYSDKPLEGELAKLPEGWSSKVLKWPPRRLWTQVRLSIEMLLHPPDVLFIPAHVFPFIHPKKTVMTVHDVAATAFPQSYNWFERWYSVFSAKRALKKLWRVIVPSEFTKKELEKLEFRIWNLEKIHVIPHGYNTDYGIVRSTDEVKNTLDTYGITKPFLLSIGRLEEKKNTTRMVEAFNILKASSTFQIPDSTFLLVGPPGHGYEAVESAIEQSPHKSDIIRPGWVDADDLPVLMQAAELLVFPSLYEGFGIPVLEAFAAGTPVVASTGNCLEEVGQDGAVYADPLSAQDIADKIQLVLEDENQRAKMIARGKEIVKQYSWARAAKETAQILLEGEADML